VNNSSREIIKDVVLPARRREQRGEWKQSPLKWSWETKGAYRAILSLRQVTQESKFNEPQMPLDEYSQRHSVTSDKAHTVACFPTILNFLKAP
jgi:hypothetical protein